MWLSMEQQRSTRLKCPFEKTNKKQPGMCETVTQKKKRNYDVFCRSVQTHATIPTMEDKLNVYCDLFLQALVENDKKNAR